MKKVLLFSLLCLALAGCGQIYESDPIGLGYGADELKMSPCACMMVYRG